MKHRILSASMSLSLLLFSIGATGCGSKKHDSPDDVFNAAKAAMEEKDMEAFMECLTEESQDVFAGGIAMVSVMMKAFSGLGGQDEKAKEAFTKIDKVMADHGLTEEFMKNMQDAKPSSPAEGFKELLKPVKDKPKFVSEMMAALESMGDKGSSGPGDGFMGELTDVKIDGDTATGVAVGKKDGKEEKEDLNFKKVDGGWLIHLEIDMPGGLLK